MTKPGTILENIRIEDFAAESKCIVRHDGQVIFVEQVAPGDIIDLRITRKKKKFLQGIPVSFHAYSEYRRLPFCQHYEACGGCQWQHVDYARQLEFKRRQVKDQLERIGHLDGIEISPVLGSETERYYRNKLEYTFSNRRWLTKEEIDSGQEYDRNGLGFHIPGYFDKVLDISRCHLQDDLTNQIRNETRRIAIEKNIPFYDLREHTGFLRNLIVRNTTLGEWMVILQVSSQEKKFISAILDHLKETFSRITSLYFIVNPKRNESYQDLPATFYAGDPYIREKMDDLVFRIGPKSFFQTNSRQAARLYNLVREYAGCTEEDIVYDLYTGTGSIALFVARQASKVVGLEYIPEAVDDARMNAGINGIGNVTFLAGDIKDMLTPAFFNRNGKPDIVITDPPRAGMHKDVIQGLLEVSPGRIVYISCNPATQARDIDLLRSQYTVVKAQPVDMFPHTQHIENIILLNHTGHGT